MPSGRRATTLVMCFIMLQICVIKQVLLDALVAGSSFGMEHSQSFIGRRSDIIFPLQYSQAMCMSGRVPSLANPRNGK